MIACGRYHSLALDIDGVVWTAGANKEGEVGTNSKNGHSQFTALHELPPIIQVCAPKQGSCSFFLDDQGNVWACGTNAKFQLGDYQDKTVSIPTRILNIPYIAMICCGGEFTTLLDYSGIVWGAGGNSNNQLFSALEHTFVKKFTPIDTSVAGKITKISCGMNCLIVMNEKSELWGRGYNYFGQLGMEQHANEITVLSKIPIANNIEVQDFCCGDYHALFLDINGGVWSTGRNMEGELGLNTQKNSDTFTKITSIPVITSIFCGGYNSFFISEQGTLYGCGNNINAQLGVPDLSCHILAPMILQTPENILYADGANDHILLADQEGNLWVCGDNSSSQLGVANVKTTNIFQRVDGLIVNPGKDKFRRTKRARD